MKNLLLIAGLMVVLSGCAVGNKHSYSDQIVNIPQASGQEVALAVHDQRPYVVSGNKTPDFVGLQRGGFGNPFDVRTLSGQPLAADMTAVILRSMTKAGFQVTPVTVAPTDSALAVDKRLGEAGSDRALVIRLTGWKSDTATNTALIYDFKALVIDKTGRVVSEKHISGRDNLGGSFWNPPKHAKAAAPNAFKVKIEEALNSRDIASALK